MPRYSQSPLACNYNPPTTVSNVLNVFQCGCKAYIHIAAFFSSRRSDAHRSARIRSHLLPQSTNTEAVPLYQASTAGDVMFVSCAKSRSSLDAVQRSMISYLGMVHNCQCCCGPMFQIKPIGHLPQIDLQMRWVIV